MSYLTRRSTLAHVLGAGVRFVAILAGSLLFGTLWHELVGHGLVGVACGGHIDMVEILGVQVYPAFAVRDRFERYGACDVTGMRTPTGDHLTSLAGAMSTWLASVAAAVVLRLRRWQGTLRWVLIAVSLWWIDLMTYTLPSWGFRRSILWGAVYSEPVEAAAALGIPKWAVQSFAIVTSAALLRLAIQATQGMATKPGFRTSDEPTKEQGG